jgi:hypothetical protein
MPSLFPASLGKGCALLLSCLAAASPAAAKRAPAQLTATFKDPQVLEGPAPAPSCMVNFIELVDERRSPRLVGVIGQRAVLAPADTQKWMRAVLSGLANRGVAARFGENPQGGSPTARFRLQTAWIDSKVETYSANVVVKIEAQGATRIEQSYRGRVSRTSYWSGGSDTMQRAVDGAFASALDAMSADLKRLCPA